MKEIKKRKILDVGKTKGDITGHDTKLISTAGAKQV